MTDDKDKYRETVFLPKTEFPMRGGLPQKEPEIVAKWQEMNLEKRLREQSAGKPKWILHDGPPYANGNIHMGHAVNKILKDVVVRAKQMQGFDSPYVPGWDCHGLPIEWKIEEQYRENGLDKDEVEPLKFRAECREFAQKWVGIQSEQFQRLGVGGNWDDPYLTMNLRSEGKIVREIHKFAQNGMLYRGAKPVMWSVVEKTALAEAEVEYKEHKSVTIWIRFPVVKTNIEALQGADIVIWTTTPWTMPSNRAIAYGKDIIYRVVEVDQVKEGSTRVKSGDKLIVAESLLELKRDEGTEALGGNGSDIISYRLHDRFDGSKLAGTVCKHPLNGQGYDFDVPLLEGDFVTDDAGTGFVHIAPGHGEDDFYLGTANGIEITDNVSDDGKFRDHVPLFAGMEVYTQEGKLGDGNFAVLKEMDAVGKLLAKGSLRHEYPHSWRSKAPLIFRTTPQWFIAMDGEGKLRDKALEGIKDTRWVPAKGEARITSMIANRPDWCISRQRAWGVPIALFVHKETKEILKDEAVLKRIGDIFEEEGSDAWWDRPAQDFLGNDYKSDDYEQVFDIVDVWFESGSTHAFVCEDREELHSPADLYLEGSDQHRGWFHSSLLESCGTRGQAPYKAVLTHGFVLDEKGYKMSKSLGNVVDPLKMMDQYGADIIRLWTLNSDYSEDIRIGKDTLKYTGDIYRRIRNTFRFLLGALDGFTTEESVFSRHCEEAGKPTRQSMDCFADARNDDVIQSLPELEQLVLHQLYEMDQKVQACIEDYDFQKLTRELHDFCNEKLSAFYFDIRKDRLYCDDPAGFERRACRSVMAIVYNALTAWFAPILCFTAEEAWSHRPEGVFEDVESVHLREFPDVPEAFQNAALAGKWFAIRQIRDGVLACIEPFRNKKEIGSSLEACPAIFSSDENILNTLRSLDMAEICITSSVKIKKGAITESDEVIRPNDTTAIGFEKAQGSKCLRCWKVLPEVTENGELCNRCSDVESVKQLKQAA